MDFCSDFIPLLQESMDHASSQKTPRFSMQRRTSIRSTFGLDCRDRAPWSADYISGRVYSQRVAQTRGTYGMTEDYKSCIDLVGSTKILMQRVFLVMLINHADSPEPFIFQMFRNVSGFLEFPGASF